MNPFTPLVLPQNATPESRAQRAQALQAQQARYQYDYPAIVAGLPMAATPLPVEISLVWGAGLIETVLGIGTNLVDLVLPDVVEFDIQVPVTIGSGTAPPPPAKATPALHASDTAAMASLCKTSTDLVAKAVALRNYLDGARARAAAFTPVHSEPAPTQHEEHGLVALLTSFLPDKHSVTRDLGSGIFGLLKELVSKIAEFLGELLGVYGRPGDLIAYDDQFRTLALPWPAGVYQTDAVFAQMRVAGPNAGILRRASAADLQGFALDDATYARVTGQPGATVAAAFAAGALYLADYSALQALQPGEGKYVFWPRALFFVPATGRRALRPVAVQVTQAGQSPVFYPGDGTPWEIAKILVNMADGNDHELVSHLGLTHLLTEPFVLATYRQLDPQHPLYVLLAPHFAGTLFINYEAQTTLIVNGGPVDDLLTGTIESGRALSANAVKAVKYNQSFLPATLVARGVADREALPDYPYRDDALRLWNEIHTWVQDYTAIYYPSEGDVTGDYELQAWVQELVTAGHIQDIGEQPAGAPAAIATRAYLARLLTQIIFTASVQHAAVNFPQQSIMAFTPAMPLAAYAPFPAASGQPATQVLDVLPPLQRGLLQQAVGEALGGIHYTVLGQYSGELALIQVQDALLAFQGRLRALERTINAENQLGLRTPYTTLLPSLIPQSINI